MNCTHCNEPISIVHDPAWVGGAPHRSIVRCPQCGTGHQYDAHNDIWWTIIEPSINASHEVKALTEETGQRIAAALERIADSTRQLASLADFVTRCCDDDLGAVRIIK